MFKRGNNRPDYGYELLNSKAWKKLLVLSTNIKLLTIFLEIKLSKQFSNRPKMNGNLSNIMKNY